MDAAMDRDIFPEDISGSESDTRANAAVESPKLRVGADQGSRSDETSRADPASRADLGGGLDHASIAHLGPCFDDGERSNGNFVSELRFGRNQGVGMDGHSNQLFFRKIRGARIPGN
jgi:hypothetical protein